MSDSAPMMKRFQKNSYLFSNNAPFVEQLYSQYLKKPTSVSEDWQLYFQHLQDSHIDAGPDIDHTVIREQFIRMSKESRDPVGQRTVCPSPAVANKQVQVLQLINAYRFRGHQLASFEPLNLRKTVHVPELELQYHDLSENDLDEVFNTGSLMGPRQASLRDIISQLQSTYCGAIGVEYMHITDTDEKRWWQTRMEGTQNQANLDENRKLKLLDRVIAAGEFERYLHTRYVGQKRFSLEGAESLIPMLDELIQRAGKDSVTEVVLGMAHRGRLNVLTNILGKSPNNLFQEFEGKVKTNGNGSGDVKYHQGFSTDINTKGGIVHLALAFNPSHLEIISPVVQGSVRARQNRRNDKRGAVVLPVLVHGDAAFAGQGVVMETFQMSEARGFTTGGTIHVIINNQIGFTTSNPLDARSTVYCTEVARMVQAPILHVNGDDPESIVLAIGYALDYRMQFNKDVVLDMVCYRRHGHSEADEPSATQPVMYQKIKAHERVSQLYADKLNDAGLVTSEQVDQIIKEYRDALDAGDCVAPYMVKENFEKPFWVDWKPYLNALPSSPKSTCIKLDEIKTLMSKLCDIPQTLSVHTQVKRILNSRIAMANGEQAFDWGFAETLAYGSLLQSGFPVRLSGQDCSRGTFFHRHAIVHDQKDGEVYAPLSNISENQAKFSVIDSLLSEEAVLGFEYGYSTAAPYSLVIWEAQFGDFANGAQVVIDQFISSGESKWGRLSGLVMLLPHGFDGQGPEHSSARLERYLQLCAEDNMVVCMPSVPSQTFHLLRRQVLSDVRKPLIVMSPKSLLRHKFSVSTLEDVTDRGFQEVLADSTYTGSDNDVKRVVMCSGKVYFDLLDARDKRPNQGIVLLRVEQLYPFPEKQLREYMSQYKNATHWVWAQEEPLNQGAWYYLQALLPGILPANEKLTVAARPASASPAVGYYQKHITQLQQLVNDALGSE